MIKKSILSLCAVYFMVFAIPTLAFAETVGVFFDSNVPQIKFAALDVKSTIEAKGFTVEMLPLSSLATTYDNKKVVIALSSDNAVTGILTTQGGTIPTGLGEQACSLRTTTTPQTSFWILGGDANGAMYGGLQIAENIKFYGFAGVYNNQESPKILKRGIKLNLPFDAKSPTYFSSNNSTASRNAIANVWDFSFWTTWFDEMARYRYNVLSVWNNHPFTSMIKLPDYPNVALNNVTGYADIYNDNDNTGTVIKTMTIDEKIEFWKKVMAYAKDRGFSFYLINWNLFLSNAKGQYNMIDGSAGVTNQATITYMRKCMYELLKTYPNLDGFGVTEGEGMSDNDEANSLFLGSTYGKGMADFAKDNPQRKLNFIHRWHMADFTLIKKNFAELMSCPNVTFDMSFKYSSAHMYSSVTPEIFSSNNINALKSNNIKTWFTVRNDDFYYHNWGDPNYARTYINNIPGQGDWFTGFYIGSDGFHQTRTFFSKNSVTQGQLEIQRLWYMNMLWGRLAFNPNTPDDVFKNYMNLKCPEVSSNDLFTAWRKASSGLPKVGEILFGSLNLDFHWYPENCQDKDGFLTIADFAAANPRSVTTLCGITGSASNNCSGKTSTYTMADQIEADALAALSFVDTLNTPANSELGVTINNIKSMSYLTIYYAYKIRGATYNKAANKKPEAINAMGKAYCWWKKYTNLMDANFTGMSCQRVAKFATWHQHDAAVLKEFTDLGGIGIPNCSNTPQAPGVYFTANSTFITPGESVQFTDQSSDIPTSWKWSFEGGNPSTSTEQNPLVRYSTIGTYPVTLIATNAVGSTTLTKTGYITVSNNIPVIALTSWVSGVSNNKVSGKNRLMIVMVMGESTSDFSAVSVTYGGQTMTKQSEKMQTDGSRSYTAIFTLNEAGVNAASSGTIDVSWSTTPSSGYTIYSVMVANVDQTIPVTASATNGLTGATLATSALAVAIGDMVVMCGVTAFNNNVTFNNGFINQFESNSSWGDGIGGSKMGSGVNETPSFTQSGSGRMALCAIVVKKASTSTSNVNLVLENDVNIYPNPVSKILNLEFPDDEKSREIKLINSLGQVLYSTKTKNSNVQFDIKSLNLKGMVVVQIKTDKKVSNNYICVQQ